MSGEKRDATDGATGSGDATTVAGCLSTDANGRFALTVAPTATGAAAGAGFSGGDAETKVYVLNGGDNLQAHLGKKVEVVGTVAGDPIDIERTDARQQQEPAAAGGDNNQPVVKTETSIDVEARQLNVREVRDVAPTCAVNP
jgi:hypothetical protein